MCRNLMAMTITTRCTQRFPDSGETKAKYLKDRPFYKRENSESEARETTCGEASYSMANVRQVSGAVGGLVNA